MAYRVSFDSCWAKLDRAKQHRDALNIYIRETLSGESNRAPLWAELDPESGYHVYRVKSLPDMEPILTNIGLMVGDVIHNVRASLDHLTWQLACSFTQGAVEYPHRVQFPIITEWIDPRDGSDAWEKVRRRNLSEVSPDHAAQIKGYQPPNGIGGRTDRWTGDYLHQLALLQDLSNTDKHRTLNVILAHPGQFGITAPAGTRFGRRDMAEYMLEQGAANAEQFRGQPTDDIRWDRAGELLELDTEVCRAKLLGSEVPAKMDMAGYVTPQIALTERRPAIPTLDRIAAFAALVISEFEPLS
jgi:hypothetical protein